MDVPAEVNREKQINFLEAEQKTTSNNTSDDDRLGHTKDDENRREQWQQGLKEGEKRRQKK